MIVTAVRKSDRSFIGAFLPDVFSEIYQLFRYPSYSSEDGQQEWSSCANLSIAMHFSSVQPIFELRITIYWISLETIVNSIKFLFDTSLPCVVGHEMHFLCVGFAVPSTVGSPLLDDAVAFGEICGWIRFQPRDVHKCNGLFLDSNKEDILSIALLELFRTTRTTLHCPFHESSLSIRHRMGCRRYFVANRLEVLLDEDDSRSSSRVREHGSFLLVSQLHVAIQTLRSQCLFPRCVNKPMDCSLSTGLTVLT